MGFLNSSILYYDTSSHADNMANNLMQSLRYEGYEVEGVKLPNGEWDISVKKGNIFKAVLGLQTALKIKISPTLPHTCVSTDVGIFGQQAIPTILTIWLWWPIVITQIWGIVKQQKLDKFIFEKSQELFSLLIGHPVVTQVIN